MRVCACEQQQVGADGVMPEARSPQLVRRLFRARGERLCCTGTVDGGKSLLVMLGSAIKTNHKIC
jgi:hypothetical protein